METLDQLNKIKTRCVELLTNAQNRTPGKWKTPCNHLIGGTEKYKVTEIAVFAKDDDWEVEQASNRRFVTSCAGAAEAGWKATIAAIQSIKSPDGLDYYLAKSIISAWEGQV